MFDMNKSIILKKTAILGLFIFVLNVLANIFYWYYTLPWFDLSMHFLGGVFIAGLALYLIKKPLNFFVTLLIVIMVGLGWEIFEAGADKFLGTNMQNITDSLSDLLADIIGGAAGFFYFKKWFSAV